MLLCVAFVCFACTPVEEGEPVPVDSEGGSAKIEVPEALSRFRQEPEHRMQVLEQAVEAVNVGSSQEVVQGHLGPPDRVAWSYTLFYSSVLGLAFDQDERLLSRIFDIVPATGPGGEPRELSDPQVLEASEAFRANKFDRQEAAAVLLSAIEPGMEAKDIGPLLGEQDTVFWEYDLEPGTKAHLSIAFDTERQVTAINTFGAS